MSAMPGTASRLGIAVLTALGLAAARPVLAQQTLIVTLAADAQGGTAPTAYGNVAMQATTAGSTVTLTAGTPVTVDMGTLAAAYPTPTFPNGITVPFTFAFSRAFTVTPAGAATPFSFTQPLGGSGYALRAGSAGQYGSYNFTLSGATSAYSLGSLGTLQAQFPSASGFSDGLSPVPATLSAVLTFVAAPEPSPLAALALGVLGLSALALRARHRHSSLRD